METPPTRLVTIAAIGSGVAAVGVVFALAIALKRKKGAGQQQRPKRAVLLSIAVSDGAPLIKVDQTLALKIAERDAANRQNCQHVADDQPKGTTVDVVHRIYQNCMIATRYTAVDLVTENKSAMGPVDVRQCLQRARKVMCELAVTIARGALKRGHCTPEAIGRVVVVSSTVLAEPGVSVALVEQLGLSLSCERTSVSYQGCAAAMTGLRVAEDFVRANPSKVSYELPSVHANDAASSISAAITHAIFGDGCAATVVAAEGSVHHRHARAAGAKIFAIAAHRSQMIPHSTDGIVLGIQAKGIDCILSKKLPSYIEKNCDSYVDSLLASAGVGFEDIGFWAVHPGGRRIIEAVQKSTGLNSTDLAETWAVLRERGNMLSPSILYVMDQVINRRDWNTSTKQYGVAFSFAPGVSVEGFVFEAQTTADNN